MAKITKPEEGTLIGANERDADLLKKTFRDPDQKLLKMVRALMYGLPLLADEKTHIKHVFSSPELRDLMRRRFLPSIEDSRDVAIGQIQDVWLGAEQMVFGAEPLQIEQASLYKTLSIENTKLALRLLADPDGPAPVYSVQSYEYDPEQIQLMARNMFLRHIDQQLNAINIIANQKEETVKEEVERKRKNRND